MSTICLSFSSGGGVLLVLLMFGGGVGFVLGGGWFCFSPVTTYEVLLAQNLFVFSAFLTVYNFITSS